MNEISELKKENQLLLLQVEKEKKHTLTSQQVRQEKIEQYEKEIAGLEKIIQETNVVLEKHKESGVRLIEQFNSRERRYKTLVDIAKLLDFPSPLIYSFVEKYVQFLNKLADYGKLFSVTENMDDIISSDDKTISDKKFNTKVVTKNGSKFELTWLIKQFGSDKDKSYYHKHDDGKIEEIKFGEWNSLKQGVSFPFFKKPSVSDYLLLKTSEELVMESTEQLENKLQESVNRKRKLEEKIQREEIKQQKIKGELEKRKRNKSEVIDDNKDQSFDKKIEERFEELSFRIENDDHKNQTDEQIIKQPFN